MRQFGGTGGQSSTQKTPSGSAFGARGGNLGALRTGRGEPHAGGTFSVFFPHSRARVLPNPDKAPPAPATSLLLPNCSPAPRAWWDPPGTAAHRVRCGQGGHGASGLGGGERVLLGRGARGDGTEGTLMCLRSSSCPPRVKRSPGGWHSETGKGAWAGEGRGPGAQQFQTTSVAVTFKPGVTVQGTASTGGPRPPSSQSSQCPS